MCMKQVCILGGGTAFESNEQYLDALRAFSPSYERLLFAQDWKPGLATILKAEGYDVLMPQMPCKQNAKYDEWAIMFDKIVPFLQQNAILVGHSLGGTFLVRYLGEHPRLHFAKLILIAAPYDDETSEPLASFKLANNVTELEKSADEIHLVHSEDDPVVPFSEHAKYQAALPTARLHQFSDRSHFFTDNFPEIYTMITDTK